MKVILGRPLHKYSKTVYSIMLCTIGTVSFGQNLSFYGLLPAWSQTGRISERVDYNLFISSTIDAIPQTLYGTEYKAKDFQLYIQPSIIYKFSPNFNLAASYTYQRNNPMTPDYSNEHRIWQQGIYAIDLSKYRLTHRIRFEERFIENRTTEAYPLSTRLRYQLGFNFPMQGKTLDPKEFYFNASNECYFSLTGDKNATFSENWLYGGIGYNSGPTGRIEIGYMLQSFVRNLQQDWRFLNLCQITYITNFNLIRPSTPP